MSPMYLRINIANSEQEFDQLAAYHAIAQIDKKSTSVIGLSTGRTTINMHHEIANYGLTHMINMDRITFFGVD